MAGCDNLEADILELTEEERYEISRFLTAAEVTIENIALESTRADGDIDGLSLEAERLLRDMVFIASLLPSRVGEALIDAIVQVYICIDNQMEMEKRPNGSVGRPCLQVSEEQLSLLLSFRFRISDIAKMLQVSTSTVKRRIVQYGLEEFANFTMITDAQLDGIASQFVINHPNSGAKSFEGYLRHMGLHVQRSRIRSSLQRIDPRGIRERFTRTLHHRLQSTLMFHLLCPH